VILLGIAVGFGWNPLGADKGVSAQLWHLDAAVQASIDALVGPPNLEDAARLLVAKVSMLEELMNDTTEWPTRHRFLRHVGDRVRLLASLLYGLGLAQPAELIREAAVLLDEVDDVPWTKPADIAIAMELAMGHFTTLNCTADGDDDLLTVIDCLVSFRNMATMSRSLQDQWRRRKEAVEYLRTGVTLLDALHLEQWNAASWDGYRGWALRYLPFSQDTIDEILARIRPAFAGPALTQALLGYRVVYLQYYTWQEVVVDGIEIRLGHGMSPAKFVYALFNGHGLAYVPLIVQLLLVFAIGGQLNVLSWWRRWLERELDLYLERGNDDYTWTVFGAGVVRGFFDALSLLARAVVIVFVTSNVLCLIPVLWGDGRAVHMLAYVKAYDPTRVIGMVAIYALVLAYRILPFETKDRLRTRLPRWIRSPHPVLRVGLATVFNWWYKEGDHIPLVTSLIPLNLIFRV
jgi:hypothetical protein